MVHCVFWRFSGGAPASQPASQPGRGGGGEGGGFPKPPSHPAAARRNSKVSLGDDEKHARHLGKGRHRTLH